MSAQVAREDLNLEAATIGWHRYAGDAGEVLGIDTSGLSVPAPVLQS